MERGRCQSCKPLGVYDTTPRCGCMYQGVDIAVRKFVLAGFQTRMPNTTMGGVHARTRACMHALCLHAPHACLHNTIVRPRWTHDRDACICRFVRMSIVCTYSRLLDACLHGMHACILLAPPFPLPRSASGHMSVFSSRFPRHVCESQQADVQE